MAATPSLKTRPASPYGGSHHYLPLPGETWRDGIFLTSAGQGVIAPGAPYPPVQHPRLYHFNWKEGRILPEFSFILITAGRGVFDSKATGQVEVSAGMVILLFPGVWHRYRPDPATGWTEKWFQFNGGFAHSLLGRHLFTPTQAVLRPGNLGAVESALDRLLDRIEADPVSHHLPLSLHSLGVLTLALGETVASATPYPANISPAASPAPVHDSVVSAALDFIWSQGRHVLSVEHVAKAVGVNRRTLERHMRAELGRGVLEEIVNVRYHRATLLLRETSLPLKTVASLAGFGSGENMRQTFLKRSGLSPSAFREG